VYYVLCACALYECLRFKEVCGVPLVSAGVLKAVSSSVDTRSRKTGGASLAYSANVMSIVR
jgi:hypothetical protein